MGAERAPDEPLPGSGVRGSLILIPVRRLVGICLAAVLAAIPSSLAAQEPSPPDRILTGIATAEGSIEIELFESAAPATVRRLKDLLEGFYDGLTFDFTRPHIEIVTETREPSASFIFPNELDAEALGLDRQLVSDTAEAMNVLQRELLVAHREKKKSGQIPDKLKHFLDQWFADYSPDFLIGVSRKQINEALGYVYQSGLKSRPVVRGSVLLKPISPTHSSARLCVLLADIPERTGRWMVIGRVTRGLDVADAISVRPRVRDRKVEFRPVNPVVIEHARILRVVADESAENVE